MTSLLSAAESTGKPGGGGSSHGIHRRFSGVWKHPVKPAGSHWTAGHQRTRTGECRMLDATEFSILKAH